MSDSWTSASENKKITVSIIAPAFNEEDNVVPLFERVSAVMRLTALDYEIVIVDNGSTDKTLERLKQLNASDARLRYVSLSRNFGHQGGIYCGLNHAIGDAVITMDADLQHPPEAIPRLIEKWQEGFQVVHSVRCGADDRFFRRNVNKLFYNMVYRLTGLKLGQADFRLLDRNVVNHLLRLPEHEKFLRGLIAWLGFKETSIPYKVQKRTHGKSKFLRRDLFNLAFQAITSFSMLPLRLLRSLGLILFVPSVLYIVYLISVWVLSLFMPVPQAIPSGWTTIAVAVIFFGSIQLLGMGILGEYIGRIYLEGKHRPDFIVSESSDGNTGKVEMLRNVGRKSS